MEKVWTVYILECGDGTLYTGITDDLQRRLRAHKEGRGAKYTRGRGPLILRYREELAEKGAALKREYTIKQLRKNEKIALFRGNEQKVESLLAFSGDMAYTGGNKDRAADPAGEEWETA